MFISTSRAPNVSFELLSGDFSFLQNIQVCNTLLWVENNKKMTTGTTKLQYAAGDREMRLTSCLHNVWPRARLRSQKDDAGSNLHQQGALSCLDSCLPHRYEQVQVEQGDPNDGVLL